MNASESRPGLWSPRRAAISAVGGLLILLAIVLVAGPGGGPGPGTSTTTPTASQPATALGDLPMVTVPPTGEAPTGTSSATIPARQDSAPPSPSSSPAALAEVRANRITVARLGIDIPIVEGDGIDTPIGKAAHYPGTSWPGGGSNIYLYGHARTGMFIGLWKARVGDRIDLGLVDGTLRTYVVTEVLPKVPWNALHYLDPTTSEQLTLQTCTSNFPTAPRFIVIAVPAT